MILDSIADSARLRVSEQKKQISLEDMKRKAVEFSEAAVSIGTAHGADPEGINQGKFAFEASLRKDDIAFICEVKRASPSKGIIAEDFPYLEIAADYEAAGADAISVLTEPEYFLGSTGYLTEIRTRVSLPLLRKDFIIDEYQLYESKVIGADALLLICALLDTETISRYIKICDSLGLSALVEAHDEAEVKAALSAGARIIGVNNRNLKTFEVDINNCVRLRPLVPENILFVAESGIKTPSDIDILRKASVDAVLIGETLMRRADKKAALQELKRL